MTGAGKTLLPPQATLTPVYTCISLATNSTFNNSTWLSLFVYERGQSPYTGDSPLVERPLFAGGEIIDRRPSQADLEVIDSILAHRASLNTGSVRLFAEDAVKPVGFSRAGEPDVEDAALVTNGARLRPISGETFTRLLKSFRTAKGDKEGKFPYLSRYHEAVKDVKEKIPEWQHPLKMLENLSDDGHVISELVAILRRWGAPEYWFPKELRVGKPGSSDNPNVLYEPGAKALERQMAISRTIWELIRDGNPLPDSLLAFWTLMSKALRADVMAGPLMLLEEALELDWREQGIPIETIDHYLKSPVVLIEEAYNSAAHNGDKLETRRNRAMAALGLKPDERGYVELIAGYAVPDKSDGFDVKKGKGVLRDSIISMKGEKLAALYKEAQSIHEKIARARQKVSPLQFWGMVKEKLDFALSLSIADLARAAYLGKPGDGEIETLRGKIAGRLIGRWPLFSEAVDAAVKGVPRGDIDGLRTGILQVLQESSTDPQLVEKWLNDFSNDPAIEQDEVAEVRAIIMAHAYGRKESPSLTYGRLITVARQVKRKIGHEKRAKGASFEMPLRSEFVRRVCEKAGISEKSISGYLAKWKRIEIDTSEWYGIVAGYEARPPAEEGEYIGRVYAMLERAFTAVDEWFDEKGDSLPEGGRSALILDEIAKRMWKEKRSLKSFLEQIKAANLEKFKIDKFIELLKKWGVEPRFYEIEVTGVPGAEWGKSDGLDDLTPREKRRRWNS